jgi:hypothetical protein
VIDTFFSRFPSTHDLIKVRWAPIILSPINGSPERFVVAVAAASEFGFHIEAANSLNRLACLYGNSAESLYFAIGMVIHELNQQLSAKGAVALENEITSFSNISIGKISDGEARSERDLALTWMKSISSLYNTNLNQVESRNIVDFSPMKTDKSDNLPVMIHNQVNKISPDLGKNFSIEIRKQLKRRSATRIASVSIDYDGPKYVANFATLSRSANAQNVDCTKRKLFDLVFKLNQSNDLFGALRKHELVVQAPALDSVTLSTIQRDRIQSALEDLSEQSKIEGVDFIAKSEVEQISLRILESEQAA